LSQTISSYPCWLRFDDRPFWALRLLELTPSVTSCPSWIRSSHIRLVLGIEEMIKFAHPEDDYKTSVFKQATRSPWHPPICGACDCASVQ
jgi:hypothetical protein